MPQSNHIHHQTHTNRLQILHEFYITATCFGADVPSSGNLKHRGVRASSISVCQVECPVPSYLKNILT